MGQHFINRQLNACNAIEIQFDASILEPLIAVYSGGLGASYYNLNPHWPSDIRWISNNNRESYDLFFDAFKGMKIESIMKKFIAHENNLTMYCGFFVTRSICSSVNMHTDWPGGNNDGFTLITPLIHPAGSPNLVYQDLDKQQRTYKYELGKALNFGANFLHSTEVGRSDTPTVLLSITYGTDIMELWKPNFRIVDPNSLFYRLPNGSFVDKNNHSRSSM